VRERDGLAVVVHVVYRGEGPRYYWLATWRSIAAFLFPLVLGVGFLFMPAELDAIRTRTERPIGGSTYFEGWEGVDYSYGIQASRMYVQYMYQ